MNLYDYIDAPLSLSSGFVTVAYTANSICDSARFQNETRLPLLLTGIKFDIKCPDTTSAGLNGLDFRHKIAANVMLGQLALTEQFCTLPLLGESSNSLMGADGAIGGTSNPATSFLTDGWNSISGAIGSWGVINWKFPRPLFYPPDMGMSVQLSTVEQTITQQVNVTLIGYYLKPCPFPKEIAVPWAAGWDVARSGLTFASSVDKWSPEMRFKNQFQVPLYLQKMIGRLETSTSGGASTSFQTYAAAGLTESRSGDYAFIEATRTGADSVDLINDLTPWWQVFDPRTFAWKFKNFALQPREYLSMRVAASGCYPFVGIHGYRHEALT